jgi:hypothetical protein
MPKKMQIQIKKNYVHHVKHDSEDEEYIITRGMLFFFNCEKCRHLEIECHEGNETEKLIEKEDNYEAELISALDELREENKSLKKELMKQKESVHIFEESQQVIENLRTQLEEARKIEENIEYQKQVFGSQHRSTKGRSRNEREDIDRSS